MSRRKIVNSSSLPVRLSPHNGLAAVLPESRARSKARRVYTLQEYVCESCRCTERVSFRGCAVLSPTTYRICEEFDLPKDIVDRQACSEPAFATSGLPLVTSAPPPPPCPFPCPCHSPPPSFPLSGVPRNNNDGCPRPPGFLKSFGCALEARAPRRFAR